MMNRRPYKRSIRVSDLVRQEVSDIIMNKIKHKTLGFVTVTYVKVSDDMRNATVYISVLNSEESRKTVNKLNSSSAFIRGELGKRIKIKYLPKLYFAIDESIAYGRKIDGMLDNLEPERSSFDEDEDLF